MAADRLGVILGEDADQFLADLLRELREVLFRDGFDVGGGLDGGKDGMGHRKVESRRLKVERLAGLFVFICQCEGR
jgi:hypothetical protein